MKLKAIVAVVALVLAGAVTDGGSSSARAAPSVDQMCNRAYPDQFTRTYDVRLGTRKVYSKDLSRALVCSGAFGAPDQFTPTSAIACDLIMAAYGVKNPRLGILPDLGCAAPNIRERGWVRGSLSTAVGVGCGYLVNVLGTGLGVLAAGATFNPGTGVVVWAGVSFIGDTIVCIGINNLTTAARSWGSRLEGNHQVNVARDVAVGGKCLQLTTRRIVGRQWSAVTCPAGLGRSTLPPATPPAGSIVRNPVNGASWLITPGGHRSWIPTGGIWLCLRDRGARVISMSQASIDRIRDRAGVHATCTPPQVNVGGADPGSSARSGGEPPVTTPPKPSATNLIAVNHGGGHVGVAFDVGWQAGRDPVTCRYFRNGIDVFSAQCGSRASKQFYGLPPGRHTFHATVTDRFGVSSDRTNSVAVDVAAAAPTPPAPVTNRLSHDGRLNAATSQFLRSSDGRYRFVMQSDSNLVLYGPSGRAIWTTGTVGRGANHLRMQGDGNLVMYTGANSPIWSSNTPRHYNAHLIVQNDGNVVIYNGSQPIWATNTAGRT